MDGISERALLSNFSQELCCAFGQLNVFFLTPNFKDLGELLLRIRLGGNNKGAVKEIDGKPVRRLVFSSSDLDDTSVCCHNNDRCLV